MRDIYEVYKKCVDHMDFLNGHRENISKLRTTDIMRMSLGLLAAETLSQDHVEYIAHKKFLQLRIESLYIHYKEIEWESLTQEILALSRITTEDIEMAYDNPDWWRLSLRIRRIARKFGRASKNFIDV